LANATLLLVERRAQQQFRHAEDAIHRRADFVAHVRHELALGLAGRFGKVSRRLEFDLVLVVARHVGHRPYTRSVPSAITRERERERIQRRPLTGCWMR
jgi:hypothetical protein